MTGIERIIEKILADAKARAEEIYKETDARKNELLEQATARAKADAERISARNKISAEERESRLISAYHLEARKLMLQTKQNQIDKVFSLALDKLCALPAEDRVKFLSKICAVSSHTGKELIILNAKEHAEIGAEVEIMANSLTEATANLRLADFNYDIVGGVVLKDGNTETNATYDTMLKIIRDQISGEISDILFN